MKFMNAVKLGAGVVLGIILCKIAIGIIAVVLGVLITGAA